MKLNRWVGYIQGLLIERGITTVEIERKIIAWLPENPLIAIYRSVLCNFTRPLFRPLDFSEA